MVELAITDLVYHKQINNLSNIRINEMNVAIQKICETASLPFIKLRTSDELKYVPKLSDFLNTFKYTLSILN